MSRELLVAAVDHLVLTVADVESTCRFYGDVLGLERIESEPGRVALGFGSGKLNLHATNRLHHPVAGRAVPGSADLCFRTEQPIGTLLRRLNADGVPIVSGPIERTGAAGLIVSVYFRDPDDNLVEVGAPSDRIGELSVRPARPEDRAVIESLLKDAKLPLDGLDDAWPRVRVATNAVGEVQAAAGIEVWDREGLLRSVVVAPTSRGQGIGEELVWRVVAAARAEGVRGIWLLTFVPEWFERLGFRREARDTAPGALGASQELRGACPDTAVLMSLPLGRPGAWATIGGRADADPRFPTGRLQLETRLDGARRTELIAAIEVAPARLRTAVAGLEAERLDTPYREGGWSVRQVVHHLADAQLNGAMRLRLALTEPEPTIRTYEQERWAELADARSAPIEWSLQLFEATTQRLVALLLALRPADFERRYVHPETGPATLDTWLQVYGWHGLHHVAQIEALRARNGW